MPEIKFYEPFRYNADYSTRPDSEYIAETVKLGDWTFTKARMEVTGRFDSNGTWRDTGYNVTYANNEISQQELDRLWQEYLAVTGQACAVCHQSYKRTNTKKYVKVMGSVVITSVCASCHKQLTRDKQIEREYGLQGSSSSVF